MERENQKYKFSPADPSPNYSNNRVKMNNNAYASSNRSNQEGNSKIHNHLPF